MAINVTKERRIAPVARAGGALVVSPALQRGIGETNNSYGVP
jgi:2-keto-3-deoxy-6-phosphogluconate aldolase